MNTSGHSKKMTIVIRWSRSESHSYTDPRNPRQIQASMTDPFYTQIKFDALTINDPPSHQERQDQRDDKITSAIEITKDAIRSRSLLGSC